MADTDLPIEIDVDEAQQLLVGDPPPLLLDVRRLEEFQIAALDNATLIPLHELVLRLDELRPHRQRRIIVYCHHGYRSLRAAEGLRQAGFERTQSMAGGIEQWSQRIDPAVPRY